MAIKDELISQLNAANKTSVPSDCLRVYNPRQNVNGAYNTTVDVSGIPEKGYSGDIQMHYNRIDLGKLFVGIPITVTVPFEDITSAVVLTELKKIVPTLTIEMSDIVETTIPVGAKIFTLAVKPESLAWQGSLGVTIEYVLADIATDITSLDLSGFSYITR